MQHEDSTGSIQLNRKHTHGFTLLELMITVALMAIVLGLAVPWMGAFIQDARLAGQVNDFNTAINLARTEAIKRRAPVSICPSSDGAACSGADWSIGWLVYVDGNSVGDANSTVAANGAIRVWQRDVAADRAPQYTINPAGTAYLRFRSDGLLDAAALGASGCADRVCFTINIAGGTECRGGRRIDRRAVDLSATGRVTPRIISCT